MTWLPNSAFVAANASRLQANELAFFNTDLSLALTMTMIAGQSRRGSEKRRRNIRNARSAYDSLWHFRQRTHLGPEECQPIDDKLSALRTSLEGLGEQF